VTQSSRGIENPTAFFPPGKMWIRISVLVVQPPTPSNSTPCTLPACIAASTFAGRMLPFQSLRLSRPMTRMFCAATGELFADVPPEPLSAAISW
jgi:hypothetical protein